MAWTYTIPAAAICLGDKLRVTIEDPETHYPVTLEVVVAEVGGEGEEIALFLESPTHRFEALLDETDVVDAAELAQPPHPTRWTRFWTRSGSEYLIDHGEKTWYRGENPDSPEVRTPNGVYWRVSAIEEGEEVRLLCPPIVENAYARTIRTSVVMRIVHE